MDRQTTELNTTCRPIYGLLSCTLKLTPEVLRPCPAPAWADLHRTSSSGHCWALVCLMAYWSCWLAQEPACHCEVSCCQSVQFSGCWLVWLCGWSDVTLPWLTGWCWQACCWLYECGLYECWLACCVRCDGPKLVPGQ